MPRKAQKDSLRILEEYDPQIRKLGMDRFLSGEQIFNAKTHKLQPRYQELTQVQQRGVLLYAQRYAKKHNKELRLYAKEKRLLAKIFKDGTAILLAVSSFIAAMISDEDDDGIPDLVQTVVLREPVQKVVK